MEPQKSGTLQDDFAFWIGPIFKVNQPFIIRDIQGVLIGCLVSPAMALFGSQNQTSRNSEFQVVSALIPTLR